MAIVRFTSALNRFYPNLGPTEVSAGSVAEVLKELNAKYDGLRDYLIEENGALRKHVNVFVKGQMIKDRIELSDSVGPDDEVHIIQALSGG